MSMTKADYQLSPSWPGSDPAILAPDAPLLVDARIKSGHDERKDKRRISALAAGLAIAACLAVGAERAIAFRGGFGRFHGGFGGFSGGGFGGFRGGGFGGFHGGTFAGGSRFGDGGFFDRSTDAGFGHGGWGSIHNAGNFSNRSDTFNQNHPDWRQNTTQF
jgi:hypothetical protein